MTVKNQTSINLMQISCIDKCSQLEHQVDHKSGKFNTLTTKM